VRIAFLTYPYLPEIGGIQVLLERVCQGLSGQYGHSVLVITRTWPGRPAQEQIQGVPVARISSLGQGRPVKLGAELWQTLRSYQADVLICVEPRLRWSLPALVVTQALRIPMLLLLAGTYSEVAHPLSRWIAGLRAKKIIGVSRYALRRYGWWPSRWHLVHNAGADIDSSLPPADYDEREEIVLTVARITPRKNLEVVIRVAHLLPHYRFVVVGDVAARPDYFRTLQRLAEKLRVQNVAFTGEVPNGTRDRLYRQARLFFLPTKHEMFGIVFAEAMAAGLPVVATDCTAVPEVVTPLAGWLLPPDSPPEAFAQAVQRLMTDRETWRVLSAHALQRASEFRPSKMVQGYAEVCAQVVRKKGPDANAKHQ